jgi:hypothetical protein
MKTVKISEGFYLNSQAVKKEQIIVQQTATNHIFVVDVSGSMSRELPLIRKQLKNKLSTVMRDGDTISIVWFSGGSQSGILKEEVEVKSLKTLSELNDAVDRWLQPVGCTAFQRPLILTKELIGRIRKNRPNSSFSMIFLTDGYNNDCSWASVVSALKDLTDDISASTFVEYGFYADSQRIQEMASILGGERISTSDFDEFEPIFDKKISSGGGSTKRISVTIDTRELLFGLVYSCDADGSIILYNIVDGKVAVNESVNEIFFFSKLGSNQLNEYPKELDTVLYTAIYVLADNLLYDEAERIFAFLGDGYYYKELMGAYGKQKLNNFKVSMKACITDTSFRFPQGRSTIKPVNDNAYCLMNLISDLGQIKDCLLFTGHKDFVYNRIGAKRVAVGSTLTEGEKEKLAQAKNVAEMVEISKELEKNKVDLTFTTTDPNAGSPLTNLVWNSERANLSILVKYDGVVTLPKNDFGIESVASFKYRSYTIVKDGILNVIKLPVSYSKELEEKLIANGVLYNNDYFEDDNIDLNNIINSVVHYEPQYIVIDMASLPIVNRGMTRSISAKDLSKLEWELVKLQGAKKVFDFYKKALFPKTSKSFADMTSPECAEWLKTIGITDYNGYAPKTSAVLNGDNYMSVNLITKIKGLSALPKVEDVVTKIEKNIPLKVADFVMSDSIVDVLNELKKNEKDLSILETYFNVRFDYVNDRKRELLQRIAEIKFAMILSRRWFKEFKSFDENSLNIIFDGQNLNFVFDLCEKPVGI